MIDEFVESSDDYTKRDILNSVIYPGVFGKVNHKLRMHPKIKQIIKMRSQIMNSFVDHLITLLDARPPMRRGTTTEELDDMLPNGKIAGTREMGVYFSLNRETASEYADSTQRGQGVIMTFNPKDVDLTENMGLYNEDSLQIELELMAGHHGMPLKHGSIDASPKNLKIKIKSTGNAEQDKKMLKKYAKLGDVEIVK